MLDPTADEMRVFLRSHYPDADVFDIEGAIYWFAYNYHGGQSTELYSALSLSEFTPGPNQRRPHRGLMRQCYNELRQQYAVRK